MNNNKITFILLGVLVIVAVGLIMTWVLKRGSSENPQTEEIVKPAEQQTPVSPPTRAVRDIHGNVVSVSDFTKEAGVIEDPYNPGQFVLTGDAESVIGKTPFSTRYVPTDDSFVITLMSKPLAASRVVAESELREMLHIDEGAMCALRYGVYVPGAVSETYAGQNLGFSFCPGAVALPE